MSGPFHIVVRVFRCTFQCIHSTNPVYTLSCLALKCNSYIITNFRKGGGRWKELGEILTLESIVS